MVDYYNTLIPDDKTVFLRTLATQYNVDHSVVLHLAKSLEAAHVSSFSTIEYFFEIVCKHGLDLTEMAYLTTNAFCRRYLLPHIIKVPFTLCGYFCHALSTPHLVVYLVIVS